jgi:hypothetical protein
VQSKPGPSWCFAGPPRTDTFGVDFSGGNELEGRGNGKIWIASWDVDRGDIALRCGTDEPYIRRAGLPDLVRQRPGWWVFDFPFGIARETAIALGIDGEGWNGWLDWCAEGIDATERRDTARAAVERSQCAWSARRRIDEENRTTWFPLFEQLYRQTIYGARDVLKELAAASDVVILPWQDPNPETTSSVVVEGFPGVTIRTVLGLQGIGYKGGRAQHRGKRERIVRALADILPVPLPEPVAQRAINDPEGDALDALVLLLAGWVSQQYPEWKGRREELIAEQRLVEGWFPASGPIWSSATPMVSRGYLGS